MQQAEPVYKKSKFGRSSRLAAMKLTDPWVKLAAAYLLTGDTERATDLLAKSGETNAFAAWLESGYLTDRVLDSLQARHPERYATMLPGLASSAAERGQIDRARIVYRHR